MLQGRGDGADRLAGRRGHQPIRKVATPLLTRVRTGIGRRPIRSPSCPAPELAAGLVLLGLPAEAAP